MNKEKHIVSISGGKDSAALAIYLKQKYPKIDFEYTFFDTKDELPETYEYITKLENILGIKIKRLQPKKDFEKLLEEFNYFLPSPKERWCTREMKVKVFLEEMKKYKDYKIFNYVGIRADENRTALIPKQENIITIMPFKDDGITLNDVKRILNETGIGLPKYYTPKKDEKIGIEYFRSRSGCYFCFFMRQIEWVWLYETHPELFKKAMKLEKAGYSFIEGMSLKELIKEENIKKIKLNYKKYEEMKKKQPIKNGTIYDEIKYLSEHDNKLQGIEKDEFCMMCML